MKLWVPTPKQNPFIYGLLRTASRYATAPEYLIYSSIFTTGRRRVLVCKLMHSNLQIYDLTYLHSPYI